MTNDYKEKLLEWLTGNYNVGSGNNIPQFIEPQEIILTETITQYLANEFPDGYFITTSYDNIYFGFDTNDNGFALLTDKFNPTQIIKQYADGSTIGKYYAVSSTDDGTYFAIEQTTNETRLVLLNNIKAKLPTEENYQMVLRNAYSISNSSKLSNFYQLAGIKKNPNNNRYVVCGTYNDNWVYKIFATEIEINSTALFTDYLYNNTNSFGAADFVAQWDTNNNLSFSIVGTQTGEGFMVYNSSGNTMEPHQINASVINGNIAIISSNEIYTSSATDNGGIRTYTIYKVNMSDYSVDTLYSKTGASLSGPDNSYIGLKKINQELFYIMNINNDSTPTKQTIYIGKIIGTDVYEYELGEYNPTTPEFIIEKNFNLYDYYVKIGNIVYDVKQIYNSLNYNGLPYQALNSMIPNSVNIYDENQVVIFARNLYNRIINNNTTTSTVEIPNKYLNNLIIELKELISETNNVITSDNRQLETNIYEQLLINFINTINMENQNDINNIIINTPGSSRLNNSISNLKDYNDTKMTKYRIVYEDNTKVIYNLSWQNIGNYYRCTFYINNQLSNSINRVELMSEDTNTIYQTIDCSNLETDKMYKVQQDVYIDNKQN